MIMSHIKCDNVTHYHCRVLLLDVLPPLPTVPFLSLVEAVLCPKTAESPDYGVDIPRFRRYKTSIILAPRSALPPKSRKMTKNKSQGATPGHRTLPLPDSARYDSTTSYRTMSACRTVRCPAITPCRFRLSHRATRRDRFGA